MAPSEALLYAIHHIFLPPELPQAEDRKNAVPHVLALQVMLAKSILDLDPLLSRQEEKAARKVANAITNMGSLKSSSGHLLEENLLNAFKNLEHESKSCRSL